MGPKPTPPLKKLSATAVSSGWGTRTCAGGGRTVRLIPVQTALRRRRSLRVPSHRTRGYEVGAYPGCSHGLDPGPSHGAHSHVPRRLPRTWYPYRVRSNPTRRQELGLTRDTATGWVLSPSCGQHHSPHRFPRMRHVCWVRSNLTRRYEVGAYPSRNHGLGSGPTPWST